MTISRIRPADLRFGDLITINGLTTVVRVVDRKAQITYRGTAFPVVYVEGVQASCRARTTLLPNQEILVVRGAVRA